MGSIIPHREFGTTRRKTPVNSRGLVPRSGSIGSLALTIIGGSSRREKKPSDAVTRDWDVRSLRPVCFWAKGRHQLRNGIQSDIRKVRRDQLLNCHHVSIRIFADGHDAKNSVVNNGISFPSSSLIILA